MATVKVNGTVTNGVIVPDSAHGLREGDRVQIVMEQDEPYSGFWEENAFWDQASAESWKTIEDIERTGKA